MRGTVESVRKVQVGTVLAAPLSIGATQAVVLSASDFQDDGKAHGFTIGGTAHTYKGILWAVDPDDAVTFDTLQLVGTATVTGTTNTTRVLTGGVEYVAQVRLDGSLTGQAATVPPHLAIHKALDPEAVSDGVRVACERDEDGVLYVRRILERDPEVRPETFIEGTVGVPMTFTNDVIIGHMGMIVDEDDNPIITGAATGSIYDLIYSLVGSTGSGGVSIDCGNATAAGASIDCGGA